MFYTLIVTHLGHYWTVPWQLSTKLFIRALFTMYILGACTLSRHLLMHYRCANSWYSLHPFLDCEHTMLIALLSLHLKYCAGAPFFPQLQVILSLFTYLFQWILTRRWPYMWGGPAVVWWTSIVDSSESPTSCARKLLRRLSAAYTCPMIVSMSVTFRPLCLHTVCPRAYTLFVLLWLHTTGSYAWSIAKNFQLYHWNFDFIPS